MRQRSSNPFLPFVLPKTALAKAFQTLLNQKDEVSNPGTSERRGTWPGVLTGGLRSALDCKATTALADRAIALRVAEVSYADPSGNPHRSGP